MRNGESSSEAHWLDYALRFMFYAFALPATLPIALRRRSVYFLRFEKVFHEREKENATTNDLNELPNRGVGCPDRGVADRRGGGARPAQSGAPRPSPPTRLRSPLRTPPPEPALTEQLEALCEGRQGRRVLGLAVARQRGL